MKTIYLIAISTAAFSVFAAPYRESTELEKRIAAAKAECYTNYDKIEAHYKFAGILYDAGCLESAFCNVESLLRSTTAPHNGEKLFNTYTRRPLKDFFPPEFLQQLNKFPPEIRDEKYCNELKKHAANDPDAAAYNDFAANAALWHSEKKADINTVTKTILSSDGKLKHLLRYNLSSAHYLYFTAKEEEEAYRYFIRLYFHDPAQMTVHNTPAGFLINSILNRINTLRTNRAVLKTRRDPIRLVIEYLHTQPRMVESFLRSKKISMRKERFLKLCLLATDSVDLQLRTFAFGELMKQDCSALLPVLQDLLLDQDAGRRAVAAVILVFAVPPEELPEYLAKLAKDPAAIVRMTVETVAKTRCSSPNYARFRQLMEK
ncbi:MAG: hypothetical protein IJY46_09310 [Lentisphaeria bacterium]|nr:hypothetical protein [Lentisphaeria bacterium]